MKQNDRWVNNIKMNLREKGWNGMDWIGLAQDRYKWRALVKAIMNLWFQQQAGKFLSGCTTGGLLRSARLHRVT
jgi:hypothetical protein